MFPTEKNASRNDGDNNIHSRVTANSYGNLNLEESGKECWIIRIPPKLASAWEECTEGTVLGELLFRKGGGKGSDMKKRRPSIEVNIDQSLANVGVGFATQNGHQKQQLPLHYSLQAMTKKVPTLHPFTRHPDGSIKVHGTVTRTANLQVIQDAKYRAFCKNRILATTVHNNRFVKPVESKEIVQQSNSKVASIIKNKHLSTNVNSTVKQGFGDAVHLFGKRMMESQQHQAAAYRLALSTSSGRIGSKRLRRFAPDEPVKSIIFQLYEDRPYWTTKDLRAASGGRPEAEIKKVLQEIANYHRSGEQKNTWELKQEYQSGKAIRSNGELRAV